MDDPTRHNRRSTIFFTLLASGIFLIGAGLIPLVIHAQQKALQSVDPIISPVITSYAGPQLTLTDLEGKTVSMQDHSGQVILVNNWATWCPPCAAEMPELQAYYAEHAAEGFDVIAIDAGDPVDQVTSFVKNNGMTFPVWLDPGQRSVVFFKNFDLPSSYVIDRSGTVRYSWTGGVNQATLEEYVTPLLEANK